MTPLQAALIRDQLSDVNRLTQKRLELAEIYYAGLKDIPELRMPDFRKDLQDIYLAFPIQYENRISLLKYLAQNNRDTTIQHIRNTADLDVFSDYSCDCPIAREVAASVLLLPTYPGYGKRNAQRNVSVIRAFFGKT